MARSQESRQISWYRLKTWNCNFYTVRKQDKALQRRWTVICNNHGRLDWWRDACSVVVLLLLEQTSDSGGLKQLVNSSFKIFDLHFGFAKDSPLRNYIDQSKRMTKRLSVLVLPAMKTIDLDSMFIVWRICSILSSLGWRRRRLKRIEKERYSWRDTVEDMYQCSRGASRSPLLLAHGESDCNRYVSIRGMEIMMLCPLLFGQPNSGHG